MEVGFCTVAIFVPGETAGSADALAIVEQNKIELITAVTMGWFIHCSLYDHDEPATLPPSLPRGELQKRGADKPQAPRFPHP